MGKLTNLLFAHYWLCNFLFITQILRYAKEIKNCLTSEFSEKILSIFLGLVSAFYLFL